LTIIIVTNRENNRISYSPRVARGERKTLWDTREPRGLKKKDNKVSGKLDVFGEDERYRLKNFDLA